MSVIHRFDNPVQITELHRVKGDGTTVNLIEVIESHSTSLEGTATSETITALQNRVTELETYIELLKTTYTIVEGDE